MTIHVHCCPAQGSRYGSRRPGRRIRGGLWAGSGPRSRRRDMSWQFLGSDVGSRPLCLGVSGRACAMVIRALSVSGGILAIMTTSGAHAFDFLHGSWTFRLRKLRDAADPDCDEWIESNATGEAFPILNGLGNIDRLYVPATKDSEAFEGFTLRLYDPETVPGVSGGPRRERRVCSTSRSSAVSTAVAAYSSVRTLSAANRSGSATPGSPMTASRGSSRRFPATREVPGQRTGPRRKRRR
jgi:hypothetical protein